jgi:hypothetical protein
MRRSAARRRYLRKHHPFPRVSFDYAWRASIDALTESYWRMRGRGPFAVHVNGDAIIHLPDGRLYEGRLYQHVTKGLVWYEGFVGCHDRAGAELDERLNAEGAVPASRPPSFALWPLQAKVSPSLPGSRHAYHGWLWVPAADGVGGGVVFRIVAGSVDAGVAAQGVCLSLSCTGVVLLLASCSDGRRRH